MNDNGINNSNQISKIELEAIDAIKNKNYNLAQDLYLQLLEKDPKSKEYNNNIANIYLIKKQPKLAIKYYNNSLNISS